MLTNFMEVIHFVQVNNLTQIKAKSFRVKLFLSNITEATLSCKLNHSVLIGHS